MGTGWKMMGTGWKIMGEKSMGLTRLVVIEESSKECSGKNYLRMEVSISQKLGKGAPRPLSQALTSLSDLTDHMDSFLLASQCLTRSGQGETDYKYFELFLETVSGFPSVPASMAGYYTTYPAIL